MQNYDRRALEYVRNTDGNATLAHFIEDHEPIGEKVWAQLDGLALVNTFGKLELTDAGRAALAAPV